MWNTKFNADICIGEYKQKSYLKIGIFLFQTLHEKTYGTRRIETRKSKKNQLLISEKNERLSLANVSLVRKKHWGYNPDIMMSLGDDE